MEKAISREMNWGNQVLKIETGKVAKQATASTIVSYGDTVVMANVVAAKTAKPDIDFFPLTVSYQEKFYAAGKIPGGFFKREGRPTEFETLTSRLIDRPIRPLFPEGFKNETQVILTVLSHDTETNPDIVAMIAASSALTLSGIPFMGPIGGCRVGYDGKDYILNPKINEETQLDLVVSGTQDAVLMVESEAKELSEEIMLGAVKFGHESMQEVIKIIINLAEECARDPWEFEYTVNDELINELKSEFEDQIKGASELAISKWGRLDCMFNNAGFGGALGPLEDIPVAEFDMTFDVLVKGVFLGMKHAIPIMKKQRSGSIINTGSISAITAGRGPLVYSAAKAAVVQLSKVTAMSVAAESIRVNAICPGYIATPLNVNTVGKPDSVIEERLEGQPIPQPIPRVGRPKDIAEMCVFLASDRSTFLTGQSIVVDGGAASGVFWEEQNPVYKTHRPISVYNPDTP